MAPAITQPAPAPVPAVAQPAADTPVVPAPTDIIAPAIVAPVSSPPLEAPVVAQTTANVQPPVSSPLPAIPAPPAVAETSPLPAPPVESPPAVSQPEPVVMGLPAPVQSSDAMLPQVKSLLKCMKLTEQSRIFRFTTCGYTTHTARSDRLGGFGTGRYKRLCTCSIRYTSIFIDRPSHLNTCS